MNGLRTCASWLSLAAVLATPAVLHATDYRVPAGTTDPTPKTLTGIDTLTVDATALLTSPTDPTVSQFGVATNVIVTNNGRIEGPAGRAFDTTGNGTPRTITINNGTNAVIIAGNDAVRVSSDIGTGIVTVNNLGSIVSIAAQGIDFDAVPLSSGTLVISNFAGGVIQSTQDDALRPGVATVNNAGTIISDGAVGSASDAIDAQFRNGTVNNFNGGLISGYRHGIAGSSQVNVTNASGGTIAGRNGAGISVSGVATIANLGGIVGSADGVVSGSFDVQNGVGAVIVGNAGSGLIGSFGGTLVNSGSIGGATNGISNGGALTIQNNAGGTILGNAGAGIQTNNNLSLINAGRIGGGTTGIVASNAAIVTNTGAIIGGSDGIVTGTITIRNSAGGSIVGNSGSAIAANFGGSLINAGSIGGGNNGLISGGNLTVDNSAGATIVGNAGAGVQSNANITLNNAGRIGGGTIGVGTATNGTITNSVGATIVGGGAGLVANGQLAVVNDGSITAGIVGISAGGFLSLTNNAAGIVGATNGAGVVTSDNAFIANSGTITGGAASGTGNIDGDGLRIGGNSSITNDGVIQGLGSSGVNGSGAANTSEGINFTGGSILNNSGGSITGANNGIVVDDGAGGAALRTTTITNSGTIRGVAGAGIRLTGALNDVVNNSGLIVGTGGPAISLGAGDDRLNLVTTSVIQGAIDGGDGIDAITLGGAATTIGTLGPTVNFETLNVQAATWITTGTSTYANGITVTNGGRLDNRGTLFGATAVNNGEIINGGLYQSLTIAGGNSAIRPGGSGAVGAIGVSGNYLQSNGAVFFADVTAGGAADRITIGGTAALESGAVLSITRTPGSYNPGTRYVVLTAVGGLTGTFGTVATDPDPLTFLRVGYSTNAVVIDVLRNAAGFNIAATTPNQAAVANALGKINVNAPIFTAVGSIVSTPVLTAVLDSISGEAYASTRAGLAQDARRVTAAIATRFENSTPRSGGWLQGIVASGRADGAKGAASLKQQAYGAVGGVDVWTVDGMRGGLAAGYTHDQIDVGARGSTTNSDTVQLALYGGGSFGHLTFRLIAGYAWVKAHTTRNVALPTPETVRSSYNGAIQFALGEISYAIPLGKLTVLPFVVGQGSHVGTDIVNETGGISALTIAPGGEDIGAVTAGVRATGPEEGPIALRGSLGFRRIIGTSRPVITASFAGTNGSFSVFGASLPRYAGVGDLDLIYRLGNRARIGIGYSGVLGSGGSDHAARVTLAVGL